MHMFVQYSTLEPLYQNIYTTAAAAAPAVAGEEGGEVKVEERELEEGKRMSSSTSFKKFCGEKESIA